MGIITENVRIILAEIPPGVEVVAAAKTRNAEEILEAIAAGIRIIGENYVQEAETAHRDIGAKAAWHFIGHLQKNKVKKAAAICDMIETVDSLELAAEIDKRCAALGKTMPVLIEINSGREPQKAGVYPENAAALIKQISELVNVQVMGLMTMGPLTGQPEDYRPYFIETKKTFENLKSVHLPRVEMKYLSMGMTGSYKVALEEGANIVRIGSKIFGERVY
jgi:pyridoxal phosphate enzyme (YggS family)